MSDQDHPAWPTADDDAPPAKPVRPSASDESTKRIQFPLVDPDQLKAPNQQTAPLGKPGYPPPEPPRAAPMRIEPGQPPKAAALRQPESAKEAPGEATVRVKPVAPPSPPPPPPKAPTTEPPTVLELPVVVIPAPTVSEALVVAEPSSPPEPPADQQPDPVAGAPERRRTNLIIAGAVVVVLALVAGVVFLVPGVRDKLGFGPAEEEVATQPPPEPVNFKPVLNAPASDAPAPSPQGVRAALTGPASAPTLGTLTGTVVDPSNGTVLWDQNASTALVPASTIKILTAAAALLKLEHGQQFTTRVVAGKDPGTVVLVGGGDTTLSSLPAGKNSVYPGAAHLDDLVAQVKAASGGKVTQVFYDLTRYVSDGIAPGWVPSDVPDGYIAPPQPAMLDGGRADGTKDRSTRNMTPGKTLAGELARRLGATLAPKPDVTAPADAKVLGEVRSAPLTELVDNFMLASDNMLAETVAREVAKAAGEEASFNGISKATLKVLQENGFDVSGATLTDGSGLSTVNKIPARLLAQVLAVAAAPDGKDPRTAKLRPLLGGLPVAGGSGTLEGRFPPGSAAVGGRGWVRAKTGTLSGVNSLAGMVLDADGRVLVFALMTTGTDALPARSALDSVAAALRTCGCK